MLRQLRIHQWVKNLLLFGAVFLAHKWSDWPKMAACFKAFVAFNLIASSAYAINDLLDLEADRNHPAKAARPLASGAVPVWMGVLLAALLATGGLVVASSVSAAFNAIAAGYLAVAVYYSMHARRRMILDVMILSGLYSLRLYAGGIAVQITISPWTAAYTSFLFLSLALLKRYAELISDTALSLRRGYERKDAIMIAILGCASGLIAALPLALYAGTPEARILYRSPQILWLLCAVHVYWVSRIWVLAHRGVVREDPVLFAIRDQTTYWLAAGSAVILHFAI